MVPSETKEVKSLADEISLRLLKLPTHNTKSIRKLRSEFSRRLVNASPRFVVALALELIRSAAVPRFVAYELVLHHPAAIGSLNRKSLQELGQGISDWGTVDAFACYLAGLAWREAQVSDGLIERWASSRDRWWRRAALVSTVPLNNKARGGQGDTGKTLKICKILIEDRDDMVVKALSWALRELSKRDAKSVRDFLEKNRGELAARVVREVTNKLKTGLKNPVVN